MAELLEKITPETCWEITAKILTSLIVMRGEKIIAPTLGKGEGIISHIWGAERWVDINAYLFLVRFFHIKLFFIISLINSILKRADLEKLAKNVSAEIYMLLKYQIRCRCEPSFRNILRTRILIPYA